MITTNVKKNLAIPLIMLSPHPSSVIIILS